MKKRTFLKTSSKLLAGSLSLPTIACQSEKKKAESLVRTNWAGNLKYTTENFYEPNDIEALRKVVLSCDKLRTLGSKHCFNKIADSKSNQVSSLGFNQIIQFNAERSTVTVGAGMTYGQLCPELHNRGYALHNLASLPHISIAGACATATHGSGVGNGNLATSVVGIEFMNAEGEIVRLSRDQDSDRFAGTVVNLGAIGVLTRVTLQLHPTFDVRQDNYLDLPEAQLLENFDTIMSSGYSVSLFADYQTDRVNQVWIKRKVEDGLEAAKEFYGATLADRNIHPILSLSAENCTDQMGVPGPWFNRLPHFKMGFTPSSGKELQAEYFVPRRHAAEAYQAIRKLKDQIGPLLMISEIRAVAADDLWMSTANEQDSMVFHFTYEQDWVGLQKVLPQIEKELDPFEVRPHWGKMFTMSPVKLQSRYPRLDDFKALVNEHDRKGKFRNAFMERNLYS